MKPQCKPDCRAARCSMAVAISFPGALEPWNHRFFRIGAGVFRVRNWTPWLLGETKLALWTAEQEPHLTRDGAPDLAKVLVGDAHGSDVLWPSRATPLWVPCWT